MGTLFIPYHLAFFSMPCPSIRTGYPLSPRSARSVSCRSGFFFATKALIMICANCQNFLHPDPKYEKNSMGLCSILERWLDSYPKRRPPPEDYDKHFLILGNLVCWPYAERQCKRFKTKELSNENKLHIAPIRTPYCYQKISS